MRVRKRGFRIEERDCFGQSPRNDGGLRKEIASGKKGQFVNCPYNAPAESGGVRIGS